MNDSPQLDAAPEAESSTTLHRSTRRDSGFVMIVVLLVALCAFLLLAMVADMQILSHVQNRKFKQDIQQSIADRNIRIVPTNESAPSRPR